MECEGAEVTHPLRLEEHVPHRVAASRDGGLVKLVRVHSGRWEGAGWGWARGARMG